MCPADCGMTPPSRNPLTCGCTFAELGDVAGFSAWSDQGVKRHAVAQPAVLSELECGLKCLRAEQR